MPRVGDEIRSRGSVYAVVTMRHLKRKTQVNAVDVASSAHTISRYYPDSY